MLEGCERNLSLRSRASARHRWVPAALGGLLLAGGLMSASVAAEPSHGKLVPQIASADGKATYACYLPKAYRAGKQWPALVIFAPDGKGGGLAEYFRASAERVGWIVIASNDSRNGPFQAQAIESMWQDAVKRFSIDRRRVYVGGFSGGARVATWFGAKEHAVGHVAIGGLNFPGDHNTPPEQRQPLPPMAYFLLCGANDLNRQELSTSAEQLRAAKRDVKLVVFPGGHTLPPQREIAVALQWLDKLQNRGR
jgi:poly(3-hydroxybutyrate) depolymerase